MLQFRHLSLALAFHGAIGLLLFFGVQCSPKIQPPPTIVAVMVSGEQAARNVGAAKVAPQPVPDNSEEQKLKSQREREKEQERAAEQQREVEQRRVQEEEKRQQADEEKRQQAAAEDAKRQQQREAEAEAKRKAVAEEGLRKVEEDKKRAAEEQQRQKAAEDAQRRAEEEANKKAEEEKRRQAEEEQKKKADAEKRKAEEERKRKEAETKRREAELQRAIANESAAAMEAEYISGVQRSWQDDLRDHIAQRWLRPPGLPDDISCKIAIELLPNGTIISVRVVQSSGIQAFDDSVVRAAQKSDPLPLPSDPKAFVRVLQPMFTPATLE